MDDVVVPLFYVVNRHLPKEEANCVMQALRITPCSGAVISDLKDTELAFGLVGEVIRANSEDDALAIAEQLSRDMRRPMLVVGTADFLDAVYSGGKREAVVKHA